MGSQRQFERQARLGLAKDLIVYGRVILLYHNDESTVPYEFYIYMEWYTPDGARHWAWAHPVANSQIAKNGRPLNIGN